MHADIDASALAQRVPAPWPLARGRRKKTAPLVSIVTPVYNDAEFLDECVQSVLAQSYTNWEHTILDNCSTDGSFEVAKQYASRDARIRVLRNHETLSIIPNHNRALREISPRSTYCKVVFADDWLFPECLESMVGLAEEAPSVAVVSAYCLRGQEIDCVGLPYSTRVLSGRETCRRHLLDRLYLFGSANSVLYRADLVRARDPFYDEGSIHADTEACFDILRDRDFGFIHQVLTFTRVRSESTSSRSSELHTYFGGMLRVLRTYGRFYLTEQELAEHFDGVLRGYYEFLGKSVLMGRDGQFWAYHKGVLAELGLDLNRWRLGCSLVATLLDAALRPKDSMARLLKRKRIETRVKGNETAR
jgi:glycosyltransferase involved in cell wall biosynthesis